MVKRRGSPMVETIRHWWFLPLLIPHGQPTVREGKKSILDKAVFLGCELGLG